MTVAVVAEKPSVARDLARTLGARRRGKGCFEGPGYVVTWALGHLVRLPEPHEIEPRWKRWRRADLPMLPRDWPLQVVDATRDQFEHVRRILCSPEIEEVVCATDAGREGELIFRYLYESTGCDKPIRRLWVSSLTPAALRRGLDSLRPGSDLEPLAAAARARSRADWLVGMNLSRAATLAWDDKLSVGRVQTPTLALVVERELAIRDFVPERYLEVEAIFEVGSATGTEAGDLERYRGSWVESTDANRAHRFPIESDGQEAESTELAAAIVERCRGARALVASLDRKTRAFPPPLLYDLTELQRHANRLYGLTARKTLALAQSLYEQKKVLSYPRTDSRHLSRAVAEELPAVVAVIRDRYDPAALATGTGERPLGSRYVDDSKVTDHHAILPLAAEAPKLTPDEEKIYDLVCRRLLMAWHGDRRQAVTTLITAVASDGTEDLFRSVGTQELEAGWKVLDVDPPSRRRKKRGRRETGETGDGSDRETGPLPASLESGSESRVAEIERLEKQTRPPRRFTEATLLTAMETAGQQLDDRELSEAMRERGLGTPATRAETIETLLRRDYVERQKKSLRATEKGIRLVERVHPKVKSAAMTGEWEARLRAIERGAGEAEAFLENIEEFVRDVVASTLGSEGSAPRAATTDPQRADGAPRPAEPPPAEPEPAGGELTAWELGIDDAVEPVRRPATRPAGSRSRTPARSAPSESRGRKADAPVDHQRPPDRASVGPSQPSLLEGLDSGGTAVVDSGRDRRAQAGPSKPPKARQASPEDLTELLRQRFGFETFRPHQEAVCRAVTERRDVLLVMPTGAGKSLCYQLPGLALGGTTLVVSPLIALMEDQVAKLCEAGMRADRIHSGRDRGAQREAARRYRDGELDFLYVAPERLAVPGFVDLLVRCRPALVAIDEAHCISHWGHDFRPEYRRLGERLPVLRPVPVIGLTATATPRVQRDIMEQLGLESPSLHIHGFRRDNLAMEVAELRPSARREVVRRVLSAPERLPAIVYSPTRKEAEGLADELAVVGEAAPYHAGLRPALRERTQRRFVAGELDVIVATIAFGMGVDKADIRTVVHTGLPGTLEGYYQEIGRAGRDGEASRAILLYSWADRRTHEFFHSRDYPEVEVLDSIYRALPEELGQVDEVRRRLRMEEDLFEPALEKLWIHGGALVEPGGAASRGDAEWRAPYLAQRQHRLDQLAEICRFAESHSCRMLHVVQHFGDQEDDGSPCGVCDVCDPDSALARRDRSPDVDERQMMRTILDALLQRDRQGTGQLYKNVAAVHATLDRGHFEDLLGGLARARLVRVEQDSFTKEGREIRFQRAFLTRDGRRAEASDLEAVSLVVEEGPARKSRSRRRKRKASTGDRSRKSTVRKTTVVDPEGTASVELIEALREWRLAEARKRRIPAFRVMNNRTLVNVAEARPGDEDELLAVSGIGPAILERYGRDLVELVARHG